jgi:hypothetical protein
VQQEQCKHLALLYYVRDIFQYPKCCRGRGHSEPSFQTKTPRSKIPLTDIISFQCHALYVFFGIHCFTLRISLFSGSLSHWRPYFRKLVKFDSSVLIPRNGTRSFELLPFGGGGIFGVFVFGMPVSDSSSRLGSSSWKITTREGLLVYEFLELDQLF